MREDDFNEEWFVEWVVGFIVDVTCDPLLHTAFDEGWPKDFVASEDDKQQPDCDTANRQNLRLNIVHDPLLVAPVTALMLCGLPYSCSGYDEGKQLVSYTDDERL